MRPLLYERDTSARTAATTVCAVVTGGGADPSLWLELDDTLFFPEGGGQPCDHGSVDGVAVLDVQRRDGRVLHRIGSPPESFEVGQRVKLELDYERRFDHMQQHTAQHLLSAIARDRFGWATTAFHLGPERCDIELDVERLGDADLLTLEEAVAEQVRAALPVTARRVPLERYEELAADGSVRSRGLPDGHVGDVRLVEIEGVDLNTCGGTHLNSTAEIEAVRLLGSESLRGGVRLYWVAGRRLRQRLGAAEHLLAELRRVLDAPTEELVTSAKARAEQLRERSKDVKVWQQRWSQATAAALAAAEDAHADFPGCGIGELQLVARHFLQIGGNRKLLLTAGATGGGAQGGPFVVVVPDAVGGDCKELGSQLAELLEGRGGGAGNLFQGRTGSWAGLAEAVALLAAR